MFKLREFNLRCNLTVILHSSRYRVSKEERDNFYTWRLNRDYAEYKATVQTFQCRRQPGTPSRGAPARGGRGRGGHRDAQRGAHRGHHRSAKEEELARKDRQIRKLVARLKAAKSQTATVSETARLPDPALEPMDQMEELEAVVVPQNAPAPIAQVAPLEFDLDIPPPPTPGRDLPLDELYSSDEEGELSEFNTQYLPS